MDTTLEGMYLNIPQSDVKFFKEFAKKMGWEINTKESLLKEYLKSRPKKVDISDEDILSELYDIRYKK